MAEPIRQCSEEEHNVRIKTTTVIFYSSKKMIIDGLLTMCHIKLI